MSNKLSRRAAPFAKVFRGQGWFSKVWAQNGLIKKGAKRRSGPSVVRKTKKTWKNKKIPKSKMEKQKSPSSSLPDQKIKLKKINNKIKNLKKCSKKENQLKILLKQEKISKNKSEKIVLILFSF